MALLSTPTEQVEKMENLITHMLESYNYRRGFEFKFERSEDLRKTRLILTNVRLLYPQDVVASFRFAGEKVEFDHSELRQIAHLGGYIELTVAAVPPVAYKDSLK